MTSARRRFTGNRRSAGVSEEARQAYWVAGPRDRVMTREGFAGTVDDVLDGPGPGNEIYYVTLDNGMGGGEYGASEIRPLTQQTSSVERTAADDYPELAEILAERPPPVDHQLVSGAMRMVAAQETYLMPPDFETEVTVDENGDRHIVGVNCPNPQHYDGDGLNPLVWDDANGYQHHDGSISHEDGTSVSDNVNTLATEGAFGDWLVRQFVREPKPGEPGYTEPGAGYSYDWCRYRRNSHCFYPKTLNEEASKQAGYAVWVPFDRGTCGRMGWEQQQHCPVGQPGPHVPGGFLDATVPWEEGGQRGGIPGPIHNYASKIDSEFTFHFTAAWKDVRAKAKKIAADGHVRIIRAPGTDGIYMVAEVQGDHDVYQTAITRVPGKFAVAMWECGCAWSSYAWGRTGRWKRYEGRMCSHALALYYEAQRQEMFGGEMQSARFAPNWRDPSILPKTHYDKDKRRSLSSLDADPDEPAFEETAPAVSYAEAMLGDGVTPQAVLNHLATLGVRDGAPVLRQAMALSFPAIWRGRHVVVTLDRSGLHVNGEPVNGDEIVNPNFDPRRGLNPHDAGKTASDFTDPCTACGGTGEQDSGHECYLCDGSGSGEEERDSRARGMDNANPENGLLVGQDLAAGQPPVVDMSGFVAHRETPNAPFEHETGQQTAEDYAHHLHHQLIPGTHRRYPYDKPEFDPSEWGPYGPRIGAVDPKMAPGPPLHPDHQIDVLTGDGRHIPHCTCGWTDPDQPVVDDRTLAHMLTLLHVQQQAVDAGYPLLTGRGSDGAHPDQKRKPTRYTYDRMVDAAKHEPGDPDQAQDFEGPTHGGVVLKAADTGRVLMLQRCLDDGTGEPDPAAGKWEFPGGGFEEGDETSLHGALREFAEEVGHPVPSGGHISHVWRSPDGVYVGHVLVVPSEKDLPLHEPRAEDNPDDPDGDNSEQVAWWHIDDAKKNPALREEVKDSPWADLKKAAARQPITDFVRTSSWWFHASGSDFEVGERVSVDGKPGYMVAEDEGDVVRVWEPGQFHSPHTLTVQPSRLQREAAVTPFPPGVMDELAFVGDLHEEPEPALPTTDGGEEDATQEDPEPPIAQPGEQVGPETQGVVDPTVLTTSGPVVEGDVMGIESRAWLMGSNRGGGDPGNADIAAAAKAHLAKMALKSDWTPAQQKELIDEGEHEGVTASNLDLLDIAGTHYMSLEESLRRDEAMKEAEEGIWF